MSSYKLSFAPLLVLIAAGYAAAEVVPIASGPPVTGFDGTYVGTAQSVGPPCGSNSVPITATVTDGTVVIGLSGGHTLTGRTLVDGSITGVSVDDPLIFSAGDGRIVSGRLQMNVQSGRPGVYGAYAVCRYRYQAHRRL